MNKIIILFLATILLGSCAPKKEKLKLDKPNIILIFTDDQGYADIGANNITKEVKTPNIDKLIAGGVQFNNGYVTAPQCAPSRAGIMTGRYQQRFGFDDNDLGPIPNNEITIAERLQKIGYTTGMVGKWHLDPNHTSKPWLKEHHPELLEEEPIKIPKGLRMEHSPESNGYDEYFWGTMLNYHANYDLDGDYLSRGRNINDERFRIDVQSDAAIQFLDNNKDNTFFLYLSYFGPHVPLESSQEYLDMHDEIEVQRRKYGLSMISGIDKGVGRILNKLEELNIADNTIIFYLSDNGAPLKLTKPDTPITGIPGPEWDGSINDPWLGEKGMLTEGGVHVPYIVYWKNKIEGGRVLEFPVSSLDFASTALALADSIKTDGLDGINLMPYLEGKNTEAPKRNLFWRFWNQAAIRADNWKYLRVGTELEFLFDLSRKEHEGINLIDSNREIADSLKVYLSDWADELKYKGLSKEKMNGQEKDWYKYHLGAEVH